MVNNLKILVIEANPQLNTSASLCVEVTFAGDTFLSLWEGARGGELIGMESPDLVILDIVSPNLIDFGALREIRRFSNVPVIVLAPGYEEADKVKALDMGADDYIAKPFSTIELMAQIGSVLRRALPAQPSDPLQIVSPVVDCSGGKR